jgi:hypothetical protein
MAHHIPAYGGRYLWWAWGKKPDLRSFRYHWGPAGLRYVRLELALAEDRVLFSDFDRWHYALNYWYLPSTDDEGQYDAEQEAWEAALAASQVDDRRRPLPEPWHSRLVASWRRILDVDAVRGTEWAQATFERLERADVVRVTEFTTCI